MEFILESEKLKKALSVVSFATEDGATETIGGHALFSIKGNDLTICATDKDKMSMASITIEGEDNSDIQFTSDPKKILASINSTNSNSVKFVYDSESKTLNVYASEDKDSYLSFASFDPEQFLTFEKEFLSAKEIKTINAGVFLSGIKFSLGFTPSEDNKKFSNMFIINGVMYSSNGTNRVGAFESPEFSDIKSVIIRKSMLSPIANIIDKTDITDITIKETEKILVLFFDDGKSAFGFRKALIEAPKFPINMEQPKLPFITIDRNILIKKLNRLSIASSGEMGVRFKTDGSLRMSTLTDRKSIDSMPYNSVEGVDVEFSYDCKVLKNYLSLFQTPTVDIYVDKAKIRCTIWSSAELEIMDKDKKEPTRKPFKAIALITQAKLAKDKAE